jgi:hypothetical protein
LTIANAAAAPPKPAVFIYIKSKPRRRKPMAQAGMFTGIGNSISVACGFLKIRENTKPLRIASLP